MSVSLGIYLTDRYHHVIIIDNNQSLIIKHRQIIPRVFKSLFYLHNMSRYVNQNLNQRTFLVRYKSKPNSVSVNLMKKYIFLYRHIIESILKLIPYFLYNIRENKSAQPQRDWRNKIFYQQNPLAHNSLREVRTAGMAGGLNKYENGLSSASNKFKRQSTPRGRVKILIAEK